MQNNNWFKTWDIFFTNQIKTTVSLQFPKDLKIIYQDNDLCYFWTATIKLDTALDMKKKMV